MSQDKLMVYDPATGANKPYPSHAGQWRQWHGQTAWLFNPWTGLKRDARDVGSDVFGRAIVDEPVGARPGILGGGGVLGGVGSIGGGIAMCQQQGQNISR